MKKQIRCAIYTRKSTEEGLEQDFNSLDAQREACESYIKSQTHEGWVLIKKQYHDGGYSGGTMERPAFKELLEDIKNNKIDIVVVYKVDRLTRSLMDFSKIIEIFDEHNASFVSITQHFNTTTSMGRLTLNILLSFAQFEREVTGERIRDKFEASRKKGLWLTGAAPYGYEKGEHHVLKIQQPYADNVVKIFETYLEVKNVRMLREKLVEIGIKSKSGKPFARGHLYEMLSNKLYLGKIVHKDKVYDGQHEPIISEELFTQVQNLIKTNSVCAKHKVYAKNPALLAGLLYDDKGNHMTTTSSGGTNKRYRYYISMAVVKPGEYEKGEITKISVGEIEKYVQADLLKLLQDELFIQEYLAKFSIEQQQKILKQMQTFAPDNIFIRTAITRVDLQPETITINYDMTYIIKYFEAITNYSELEYNPKDAEIIQREQKVRLLQAPQRQNKIIIQGERNYDMNIIQALIKSFWYNKLGAEKRLPKEARNGNNKRLRKLRFLPPEMIEAIMNGTQDPELNVKKLIAIANEYVKT